VVLIANAVVQNDPDQLTEAMRNGSNGFVVSLDSDLLISTGNFRSLMKTE
jgi:hypothetical protein